MKKPRLTNEEIKKIISLRKIGHSLSEIMLVVPKGKATIHKYIKNIVLSKKYKAILEKKQRGSRNKIESKKEWELSRIFVKEKLGKLTKRDLILISGMLYWGEGNKKYELNIINSDPLLMRIFIMGLMVLGVSKDRIKISIRLYSDLDESVSVEYWTKQLGLSRENLVSISYVDGKKKGKLPYGMCRLRVQRGGLYFKQLISIMDYVKSRCSSTDRMAHS